MGNKMIVDLDLYLVRHGQSLTNAGVPWQNEEEHHDGYLSPVGERQAQLLGERFSHIALDHVLSSSLHRAMQTGMAVVAAQPENGAKKLEVHPIFTEWGVPASYKGHTIEELQKEMPAAVLAEGAEKYDGLVFSQTDPDDSRAARGMAVLEYLKSRFHNGERVLVAAHGCLNTWITYAALGANFENPGYDPGSANTGVTRLFFFREGYGRCRCQVGLEYYNDTSHLYPEFPMSGFDEP